VLPEVRSVGGAAWVFIFSLYPYVYLLARTALGERAAHLMEAARLLGAPLRRRVMRVALPLARPAVMAGVALALMETLADFGVASYFGIQTFTTGIYKAWLAMDNRLAAAQLATMLLVVVAVLLKLESRAQQRMRFSAGRGARAGSAESRPVVLRGRRELLAWLVCALPVLMGFVLPVLFMLRPLVGRLVGLALGPLCAMGIQQRALGRGDGGVGGGGGDRVGLESATRARPPDAGRGANWPDWAMPCQAPSLWWGCSCLWVGCRPWRHSRAWAIGSPLPRWVLCGAYLLRFCAVALQSVQSGYSAHSLQHGRFRPHAGRHGVGDCSRGCTGRCCAGPPMRRRCWCLWMS
jgi:iron(III) transport system permease protein